jgi:predicted aspartyl protease
MKLAGRDAVALVDTGASMCAVSLSFVRGLGLVLQDIDISAEMASGDSVLALGLLIYTLM